MSKKVIATKFFVTVTMCNNADLVLKFDSMADAESFVNLVKKNSVETCIYHRDEVSDKIEFFVESAEFYSDGSCQSYPECIYSCDVEKNRSDLEQEISRKEDNR